MLSLLENANAPLCERLLCGLGVDSCEDRRDVLSQVSFNGLDFGMPCKTPSDVVYLAPHDDPRVVHLVVKRDLFCRVELCVD